MNSSEHRFINNIIQPWGELNDLLAQPYALEPSCSKLTRLTESLTVAIKHQVDVLAEERSVRAKKLQEEEVNLDSEDARLISDIADKYKHTKLRRLDRDNSLFIKALFEVRDGKFGFIRNSIVVTHATLGQKDFMEVSLEAIKYWITK